MTQIASEDYPNLRIYLHVDTVAAGFDPALMQREHRARRRLNAGGERGFDPMVTFSGNQSKGGGKFTPALTQLRAGVRVIPYDTNHTLDILNEIVNIPDGLSDRDVFDRTGTASMVDIDPTYSPVEIREVTTGGVSEVTLNEIAAMVERLYRFRGLDPLQPWTITPAQETAGGTTLAITGNGVDTTTVTAGS